MPECGVSSDLYIPYSCVRIRASSDCIFACQGRFKDSKKIHALVCFTHCLRHWFYQQVNLKYDVKRNTFVFVYVFQNHGVITPCYSIQSFVLAERRSIFCVSVNTTEIWATSKTWTHTLDANPEESGPTKAWTLKNQDPEKTGPGKTRKTIRCRKENQKAKQYN